MLAQKMDAELHIIKVLHSHDSDHEINNITNKQSNNQKNMGPWHACCGPHLARDCNESIYNRCRPNLDSHASAKCIRKIPPSRYQKSNPVYNSNSIRSQYNGHNDPNIQLSVSTSKSDHITKLLEATKKMTKHFKKPYKYNKTHHNSTDSHHANTNQHNTTLSENHKCKSHNTSDPVNEIIGQTHASKNNESEPKDKDPHDFDSPDSDLESSSGSE